MKRKSLRGVGIRGICPHCHEFIKLEPEQIREILVAVLENMLVAMRGAGVREK